MNKENLNDVFSEKEIEEINEKLKKTENIELPENLSPEAIEEKLKNVEQFVPTIEKESAKKPNKKKILFRILASAAAFVIAFTSVMIIKPWEKEPILQSGGEKNETVQMQNYDELETMFAEYSENYKKWNGIGENGTLLDKFISYGSKLDAESIEDAVMQNSSASLNSSIGADQNSTPTKPQSESATTGGEDNHGETNEQVKGVSEADIIKNDGECLYIVNPDNADWSKFYDDVYEITGEYGGGFGHVSPGYNPYVKSTTTPSVEGKSEVKSNSTETTGKTEETIPVLDYDCSVSIVLPEGDGSIDKVWTLDIAKPEDKEIYYMCIQEIYVSGDTLTALVDCRKFNDEEVYEDEFKTYGKSQRYYGGNDISLTMAVVFDISNRAEPVEIQRVYQDGYYVSSRLIDNQLVVISNYYVDITLDEEYVKKTCIPQVGCDSTEMSRVNADCITVMENVYDSRYLVVSSLNISDKNSLKTQAVLGAGENVYCTTENLYATSTDYVYNDGVEEIFGTTSTKTQIYKFDIKNYDVKYLGCGEVEGCALNQFSMDEYNGFLRIATTSGDWGDSLSNQLYVLDENLKIVGSVENIAKGETIKSVRFTGDTGYVVTFEQTDPLFVIDLSNPQNPVIKGELKIPGFSTYLHPVGENLLLGVGVDGDENGQNNGMKVSLFDVSDPENPVECDKFTIDGFSSDNKQIYVDSAAYYTHKALCWDGVNNTMYIPYGRSEFVWATYDYSQSYDKFYAGVFAVAVDVNTKKLSKIGDYISNSSDYEVSSGFTRATYMGNVLFGYSEYENILESFDKNTQKSLDLVKIS